MKHSLLLSVLSMGLLTACSTAFKAGQTPDDVYYSPGRETAAVVKSEENNKQQEAAYQDYVSSLDDRYLRMKIANRSRWSSLDNFDYWYDSRYDFGTYNYSYYNTLNPYAYWNPGWNLGMGYGRWCPGASGWGWNSPIYTVVHYINPSYPVGSGGSASTSNITAFRSKSYNNNNYGFTNPNTGSYTPPNNSSFGSLIKKVFSGSGDNASSYDRAARSFSNPGSSSSSRTTTTPSPAPPPTSSSAGGSSGGFPSTGSSTSTGRGGKG